MHEKTNQELAWELYGDNPFLAPLLKRGRAIITEESGDFLHENAVPGIRAPTLRQLKSLRA